MCITSVSVRILDMIRHRIMVLLYFGETPHGGHAFVPRFSRNSYYTTICDRIARGTAPRIRIRGKSFFSTKKDGTKPSFLVTIFSWKIKAICTGFVRCRLKKLLVFCRSLCCRSRFSSRSRCRSHCGYRAVREDTFQTGSQTSQPLNLAGDNDLGCLAVCCLFECFQ